MALLLLLLSFVSAIYGVYIFASAYFGGEAAALWPATYTAFAFAVIPYMVAKCLSEMVAIRQRHLLLEQLVFFNQMQARMVGMDMEAAEAAARQTELSAVAQPNQAVTGHNPE